MSNRNLVILLTAVFICLTSVPNSNSQITVTPKASESKSSKEDDYIRRNLKAVRSLINVGNYERARKLLLSLEKTYGPISDITREYKNIYRAQMDYVSLKKFIFEELETAPDSFDLTCQLGEAYYYTDSLQLADSLWEQAFKQINNIKHRYLILARYYYRYSFYDRAVSVYRRARILLDKPELFSAELIDIFISQQNYSNAVDEYLNLLKYEPDDVGNISYQILDILRECKKDTLSGQPEIVEQLISQAIRNEPDNPVLYRILGDIHVVNENLIAAFDNYKHADILASANGRYLSDFAMLCFNNNKYNMAIEATDYYLENIEDKKADEIMFLKARSLAELGIYQPALDILSYIEKTANNHKIVANAILFGAEIYESKLNDLESAKNELTKITQNKRFIKFATTAKLRLAEIHIMLGEYESALSGLKGLTAKHNQESIRERALFLQAEISFFNYDFKQAVADYKRLIQQHPDGFFVNDALDRLTATSDTEDDTVLYFIADAIRHDYSGNTDSSIQAMEQATKFENSKALEFVLFSLAGYYIDMELQDNAISIYEKYNLTYPEGLYTDRILFNLAKIYITKSQPGKAGQLLNELITDYPSSPLIEKARLFLNKIKSS